MTKMDKHDRGLEYLLQEIYRGLDYEINFNRVHDNDPFAGNRMCHPVEFYQSAKG